MKMGWMVALAIVLGAAELTQSYDIRIGFRGRSGLDHAGRPISLASFFDEMLSSTPVSEVNVIYATNFVPPMNARVVSDVDSLINTVMSNMERAAEMPQAALFGDMHSRYRPRLCLHACRDDIKKFCSTKDVDSDYIGKVNCLEEHKESLSARCVPIVERITTVSKHEVPWDELAKVLGEKKYFQGSDPILPNNEAQPIQKELMNNARPIAENDAVDEPPSPPKFPNEEVLSVANTVDEPVNPPEKPTPSITARVAAGMKGAIHQGFLLTFVQALLIVALFHMTILLIARIRRSRLVAQITDGDAEKAATSAKTPTELYTTHYHRLA